MIYAAHQPNYIPWFGYFYKMAAADRFVLADDVQYTTQSFINRTRIKTVRGAQWLTVPVLTKGKGYQKIKDVKIDTARNWQKKHWKSLQVNYSQAPYFDHFAPFFEQTFQKNWNFLYDLNVNIIEYIRSQLNISCPMVFSSELKIDSEDPTDTIVQYGEKLGCDTYLAGQGGSRSYLDEKKFQQAKIELIYTDSFHPKYPQQFGSFISHLSVIDLLFNGGTEAFPYPRKR